MIEKTCDTYYAKIYIAGPIEVAKQIIRRECLKEGLCVTIEPTLFIYTGGEEYGYVVGLVNYPRFEKTKKDIEERAFALMNILLSETYQHSAMMVTPDFTKWISKREQQ